MDTERLTPSPPPKNPALPEREGQQRRHRRGGENAVQPVEQAAMARNEAGAVLHFEMPLDRAFQQVTSLRGYAEQGRHRHHRDD